MTSTRTIWEFSFHISTVFFFKLTKIQIVNVIERKSKVDVKLRRLKYNRISFGIFDETKEIRFSVNMNIHTRSDSLTQTYAHARTHTNPSENIDDGCVKQQTNEPASQPNGIRKNSNNKSRRHNINTSRSYTYTGIASVISVTIRLCCMR